MQSRPIRNRIKGHRRVRAGDLIPHVWNFRTHPEQQRTALLAICEEVGFARSLLAWRTDCRTADRQQRPKDSRPAGNPSLFFCRVNCLTKEMVPG